jgi:hypothetical protein
MSHDTIASELALRLRQAATVSGSEHPVAAVIWTDAKSEWLSAFDALRRQIPELLCLGAYNPERGMGPAIWLRCVVDKTIAVEGFPAGAVPILYVPGYSRAQLRADDLGPSQVRPLVDLALRGKVWTQPNTADWGVMSFLGTQAGLGLNLAGGQSTQQAVLANLPDILNEPLSELRGRQLDADFFQGMVAPDVIRSLLKWMEDPEAFRASCQPNVWQAFSSQVATKFDFDVDVDGHTTALELLCKGGEEWEQVWQRFGDAPQAFPGIVRRLGEIKPPDLLAGPDRWLSVFQDRMADIRQVVEALVSVRIPDAIAKVAQLEAEHGQLREIIWVRLGKGREVLLLKELAALANFAARAVAGTTPDTYAQNHADKGWQADAAYVRCLGKSKSEQLTAFGKVATRIYAHWADETARGFQAAYQRNPLPTLSTAGLVDLPAGCCLLFADGLRFDVGQEVAASLRSRGLTAEVAWRWSALPSVTATAKPAVTPVAKAFEGRELKEDFAPQTPAGKPVVAALLRAAMAAEGIEILESAEVGPAGAQTRGWIEFGNIDSLGHKVEADLAQYLQTEVDMLAGAVQQLVGAGWRTVKVVTDHGWLMLDGGLPKVDLPRHLTETRWGRSAVASTGTPPDTVQVAWFWNPSQTVHTPPGIACFNKVTGYSHGGLSPQECVIPVLTVRGEGRARPVGQITTVTWAGFRCLVDCAGAPEGSRIDVRLKSAGGKSAIPTPKAVPSDGHLSIPVDDEHEGQDLYVVLLDRDGATLSQRKTRLGQS